MLPLTSSLSSLWLRLSLCFLAVTGLIIKAVSQTIKNEAKEQRWGFLGILLGTLGASLLRNLLAGKGTIRTGERTVRAGQEF